MNKLSLKAIAIVITVAAASSSQADLIDQVLLTPGAGVDWNDVTMWNGGNPVVNTNDYQTVAGPSSVGVGFTAGGITWNIYGYVRDATSAAGGTFNGGSLIINPDTRLLMKAVGASPGSTSTANIVLNGGFIQAAPNSGGVANLAGTINLAASIGAIGTNPSNAGGGTTLTLNINSTITGAGILQLVNAGDANSTRISHINLNGNISAFTGTFYLSSSTSNNNIAPGSSFSIASSAPLAGLELATDTTNFMFDLNSNITFGSVTVNGTILAPGVYDFAALDAIATGKFTNSGGTITVVPEPSTVALCVLGFGAVLGARAWMRRRASR